MSTVTERALSIARKVAYWTIPPGITQLLYCALTGYFGQRSRLSSEETAEETAILQPNRELCNRHVGERCFILATGPSISKQDLSLLEGELCISVANFFVHPEFARIRPRYHCVAPLHPPFTDEDGIRWFRSMEPHMGHTTLVLSYSDKRLVDKNGLFAGREVRYVRFGADWTDISKNGLDLSRLVPGPQSVSIMALMVALYIGCSEIYLLGVDHTSFNPNTGKYDYRHFYDRGANRLGELSPPEDLEWQFLSGWRLWSQYKALRSVALTNSVAIYNATAGGILDVFPRVNLEVVLREDINDCAT